MAVHLPSISSYLRRTTGIVAGNSNYTCIYWVRYGAIPASTYATSFLLLDDPAVYTHYVGTYFLANGHEDLEGDDGTTFSSIPGQSILANTFYPIAYTRNGNVHSLYISGVLIGSFTANLTGNTYGYELLGSDVDGGENASGIDFYNFREWNVTLSGAQIIAEINSPSSVVHASGLVTYTPLTSDLLDVSGNGNNWTQVGSISFVNGPFPPSAGNLFIPSDAFDSVRGTATIIDSSTGAVKTFLPFVTADQGGRLSSGVFALAAQISSSSGNVNALNVYDTSFNLLGSVSIANWFSPAFTASKTYFYLQNPSSPFTVIRVTSAGVLDSHSWILSAAADAIAVTDDDSILYWIDGLTIKAFDLVNNVALPDILTLPVTQVGGQIIVVNSNQFIISRATPSSMLNWEALRYDNTGTLLATYGPVINAGDYDAPEIFLDYDASKFWMRAFDTDTDITSTWYKFVISTGAIATTFTTPDMDGGGTVPTTCPVIPMGAALVGTIIVGKASIPVNSETFTMNVSGSVSQSFTIGFQGTESLSLPPGTYSIIESPDALYQPQYNTSNGNPNTAIALSAGQLIDLVIVNQLSAKYGGLYQLVPGKKNDTLRNQDGSTTNKMINWFFELFTDRDK